MKPRKASFKGGRKAQEREREREREREKLRGKSMDLLGAYCSDDSDSERDEAQERGEGVAPGSPGSPAAATSAQHEHGEDRGARVLSGGAGRGQEKKKRVVNFLVPSAQLKPLRGDEDYRPKKRQLTDNKSASLFDSLPAPRIELKEFSSHSNNLSSATDKVREREREKREKREKRVSVLEFEDGTREISLTEFSFAFILSLFFALKRSETVF